MKKVAIFAVAVALLTGTAMASSIAVPWFVDNAAVASGLPPAAGITSILYLKNNTTEDIEATIQYFTSTGVPMGPFAPGENTFSITALASIGARLVEDDSSQEASPGGRDVPNRPRTGVAGDAEFKKNGSAIVQWVGAPSDIQGQLTTWQAGGIGYAHLLPAGAAS